MSASAFSLAVSVPSAGLSVTRGEVVAGGAQLGATRHFHCGFCKSWLFTSPELSMPVTHIRGTQFDDASWLVPFVEFWTAERLPWARTGAAHAYAAEPPLEDFVWLLQEFAQFMVGAGG
jgi:hypothetical protein